MKQLFLFSIVLFISAPLLAQSVGKGRIQFKAGIGSFFNKEYISNIFFENELGDGGGHNRTFAETSLSLLVNTHKDFALGVNLVSESNSGSNGIDAKGIGISAEYYIINNPYFNLYLNTTAGKLSSDRNIRYATDEYSLSTKGSYNSLGLGMNAYIGNIFGFYALAGYKRQGGQTFDAQKESENLNNVRNIEKKDLKFLNRGAFLHIGITIKLRNK